MLKIGVTGGIGSGKSMVCKIFSKYGIPVFHSDEVSKELCNSSELIRKQLIRLIGQQAYSSEGKLNREYIASKIFANKNLKKKVEAIIHPEVKRERKKRFKEWERKGHKIAIVESALLFEAGLDKELDSVIFVEADKNLRIKRVSQRDSISNAQVKQRLKNQLVSSKNIKKADFLVYNNSTLKKLESNVRFLYNLYRRIISKEQSD